MKNRSTLKTVPLLLLPALLLLFSLTHGLRPARATIPANFDPSPLLGLDLRVFVAAKPVHLILVEKDRQRLSVVEHDGQARLMAQYSAVTGENAGPKEKEGDARTPEGIYFITKIYTDTKITVFGKRAFHLDYPNIFDRRSGKGGSGIFVHGTNRDLTPNSTNGCITLDNNDLDELAEYLPVGTVPVVVVDSLDTAPAEPGPSTASLTAHGFQKAKSLLLPPEREPVEMDFENLFLVRASGQSVAVATYRTKELDANTPGPVFARAYLDYDPQEGWLSSASFHHSLEPAGLGLPPVPSQEPSMEETLAALQDGAASQEAASQNSQNTPAPLWQAKEEDVYLTWYRQTLYQPLPVEERPDRAVLEEPQEPAPGLPPFSMFVLAAALSVGSAWLFMVSRFKRLENEEENGRQAADQGAIERIKDDMRMVTETLTKVRSQINEEERVMEEYRQKVEELEEELQQKQAEIDGLTTEMAARRLKEMAGAAKEVSELASLRQEVKEAREQLQEAEDQVGRLSDLEGLLAAQKEEAARLVEENDSLRSQRESHRARQEEENRELHTELTELQEVVTRQTADREEQEDLLAELKREVARRQEELDGLTDTNNRRLRGLEEEQEEERHKSARLRREVDELEGDLVEERRRRREAEDQAGRIVGLEERLDQQGRDLDALTRENDDLRAESRRNSETEEELARLRENQEELSRELNQERERQGELQEEMSRFQQLEEDLARRCDELESLGRENAILREEAGRTGEAEEEIARLRASSLALDEALNEERQQRGDLEARLVQLSSLEGELTTSRSEVERLAAENSRLQDEAGKNGAAADEASELRLLKDQVDEELGKEQQRRSDLEARLEQLGGMENDLAASRSEVERLAAENSRLQDEAGKNGSAADEASELRLLKAKVDEELNKEQQRRSDLEARLEQLGALGDDLTASRSEIERLIAENKRLQEEAGKNNEVADEAERLRLLKTTLAEELDKERQERQEQQERLEKELAAGRAESETLRQQAQQNLEQWNTEKSAMENGIQELKDRLQRQEEQRQRAEEELEALQRKSAEEAEERTEAVEAPEIEEPVTEVAEVVEVAEAPGQEERSVEPEPASQEPGPDQPEAAPLEKDEAPVAEKSPDRTDSPKVLPDTCVGLSDDVLRKWMGQG